MIPIIFNTRDEFIKVDIEKMVYALAEDNYVQMVFRNGQKALVCTSLNSLERLILSVLRKEQYGSYTRIGRSLIVNNAYITHINLPKQHLVLSDLDTIKPIVLSVPKAALKVLKTTLLESNKKQS